MIQLRDAIANGVESSNLATHMNIFNKMTNSLAYYVRNNRKNLGANDNDSEKIKKLARFVAKNQFDRELNQLIAYNIVAEAGKSLKKKYEKI